MKIEVKQVTPRDLWRECAEMTSGKPCKMSWAKALVHKHSIIRAQMWLIKIFDAPHFVVGHLVRHVHAQPYVQSKRTDRGGEDFNDVCRNLAFDINTAWITKDAPEKVDIPRLAKELSDISSFVERMPEKFDRLAPQSVAILLNAEEIINISRLRLCGKASKETREIWQQVIDLIADQDQDLANHCIPQCVYCGFCSEPQGCGLIKSPHGEKTREDYLKLYER